MKTWAAGAGSIFVLAACGAGSGAGGTGGHATGSGDPCASGADCSQCADRSSCFACNTRAHPSGVDLYDALLACALCQACYTTCDGASHVDVCPTPPASADACDGAVADDAACQSGAMSCQVCATKGTCSGLFSICTANPDCQALLTALPQCPPA